MLMRFWQALVMAGLSMIAGSVLLVKQLPVRTDDPRNAVTDLALVVGYVYVSTWAVAGALVAVVWAIRALAPGLPRLQYREYNTVGDATVKQRLDAYRGFWWHHSHHYYDPSEGAVKFKYTPLDDDDGVRWGGWRWLEQLVDLVPVVVGCLALLSPVREVVPWLGVAGIVMVLIHFRRHGLFLT